MCLMLNVSDANMCVNSGTFPCLNALLEKTSMAPNLWIHIQYLLEDLNNMLNQVSNGPELL